MHPYGVVLANEPRLLREMLRRVIGKHPDLQVVAEITDLAELASTVEATGAEWVVASLSPDGRMPGPVDSLLVSRPAVSILAVACDGSAAKIRCAAWGEKPVHNMSLDELSAVLGKRPA